MDSTLTRSLSNRKGRGRRSGGREREPRRAGRLVWNRNYCVLIDYRLWAAKSEGRQWVEHCIEQCKAQQVLKKKFVRLASVFPSPPFRSSDFAGLRRPRLYGFHTGTRSLSNRKGRGRRRGGREREPRRAGEGR